MFTNSNNNLVNAKTYKRIEWIDICKALGIYLVVLGHVGVIESINIWKASFYMPLFFILSGLCFNEKKYITFSQFLKKRFLSLFVPYIVFSIFLYLVWNGIAYLFFPLKIGTYLNLFTCMCLPASTTSCYGTVNWFLPALFSIEILFYFICHGIKYSRKKCLILMILISMIAYIYPLITNYRLPLALDSAIMGLSFYGIGWNIRKLDFVYIEKFMMKHLLLSHFIIIFLLLFFAQLSFVNKMTNIRTLVYGDYVLYLINAIGTSFVFIILSIIINIDSKKIKILNVLKIIGKHTLVILLFNSVIANIYKTVIDINNFIINNKMVFMLNNIFISIVILILCVIISIFINKYFPYFIGKKKYKSSM